MYYINLRSIQITESDKETVDCEKTFDQRMYLLLDCKTFGLLCRDIVYGIYLFIKERFRIIYKWYCCLSL